MKTKFVTSKNLKGWLLLLGFALLFAEAVRSQGMASAPKAIAVQKEGNYAAFTVKGSVRDKNGYLTDVSVVEKGTSNAAATDKEGKFTLSVSRSNATLVFSFVGYKSQEINIAGRSEINVVLESGSAELASVVVTALGLTKSRRSLAYSIAEVKSEDLTKASNPNLLKSLDGKVSGVNLTNLSSD